jgi:hypothetical protein
MQTVIVPVFDEWFRILGSKMIAGRGLVFDIHLAKLHYDTRKE